MDNDSNLPLTGFKTSSWVKKRYNISNSTLHLWQNAGNFPKSVKIGPRAVRFRVEDLRAFEARLLSSTGEV